MKYTVLFYRDYMSYTGGHQKVADYFEHFLAAEDYEPFIAFSEQTRWDHTNPWHGKHPDRKVAFQPERYDFLFLAGLDWHTYLKYGLDPQKPVINLIQSIRHGNHDDPRNIFLQRKAIRICVSSEVTDAIRATGKVSGPIFTIPNGHFIPSLSEEPKDLDVLVVGGKRPDLARKLAIELNALPLRNLVLDRFITREKLLETMNRSRIAILLPKPQEGFYLVPLEAMKYCELTIVPTVPGLRSHYIDGKNCLAPKYTIPDLVKSLKLALEILNDSRRLALFKEGATQTLFYHSLDRERRDFLEILRNIQKLWSSQCADRDI